MSTRVAFLWHLHQPDYRDPDGGPPILPWVRLHASAAYFDLAWMHQRHPGMRSTVNLVPVLVEQIQAFVDGARDQYWHLSRKPARDLTSAERGFLVQRFFAIHRNNGVRARPRYWSLFNRRPRGTDAFEIDDLRDLQVLFNLAWFGFAARVEFPFLQEMERKGRGFREDEKRKVLDLQVAVARRVLPTWRALAEAGQIELTSTPYYHPILPLLIDSDEMAVCQPQAQRPPRFEFPADAEEQVRRARAAHARVFGAPPAGMWPAEGAVSQAAAEIFAAQGVAWIATDEAQLFAADPSAQPADRDRPHRVDTAAGPIDVVFRDRALSDLIGFTYARNAADVAVNDLLTRIRGGAPGRTVVIALDGENPWESYPADGRPFLDALFGALVAATDLEPSCIGPAIAAETPRPLARLASGSWINGDYGIWIGGAVENVAWRLLGDARRALAHWAPEADPQAATAAREHLLAAEGSDWFWWFGEPFHSENDPDFDRLFRARLSAAWRLMGQRPPIVLDRPLAPARAAPRLTLPRQLLAPQFAARDSTWFEWAGAGEYRSDGGGAMYQATRYFAGLKYGFDLEHAYLRLEPAADAPERTDCTVRIRISGPHLHIVDFGEERATLARLGPDLEPGAPAPVALSKQRRGVIELGVPFADLDAAAGDQLRLVVYLMRERVCLARFPETGEVVFTVPDGDFELTHWSA